MCCSSLSCAMARDIMMARYGSMHQAVLMRAKAPSPDAAGARAGAFADRQRRGGHRAAGRCAGKPVQHGVHARRAARAQPCRRTDSAGSAAGGASLQHWDPHLSPATRPPCSGLSGRLSASLVELASACTAHCQGLCWLRAALARYTVVCRADGCPPHW